MYQAYITRLKNVRPHPNADRLQLGDCFGNTVCVSLDYKDNQLGVYFPTDGQLSEEYCEHNNLVRKKDDAGNNIGGYMDPNKRNVTAIRLRGEKSDGLFMPLDSLAFTGVNFDELTEGFAFTAINGHEICQKYIPRRNNRNGSASQGNRTRNKKAPVAPLFVEHADTEQLAYNQNAFRPGDDIEITLKMHGTSQRTGYLPVLKGYKRTFFDRLFRREGTPIYDYGYVSGTRRTVLEDYEGGYYGSNAFRETHSRMFEGKLMKGETVYYEVVGFTSDGKPIMKDGKNKKVGEEFVAQYGDTTTFSYGCLPNGLQLGEIMKLEINPEDETEATIILQPQSDMYVYRMTMTNEDGFVVEYTPDFMRYRCEQMGVKCVPVFWKGQVPEHPASAGDDTISAGEWVRNKAELFYEGADPIGKTHTREGVVVRIINRPKFCAYKHKNFEFKVLDNIVKVEAEIPDIEEAEELIYEENAE